jgi:hypothetical protein
VTDQTLPENPLAGVRDIGVEAYGWLHLTRRGAWQIRGAPVTHPAVRAYLAAHYGADTQGRWYVQNGPQQAYVSLETAPLVVHLDARGAWRSHLDAPAGALRRALLDEQGGLWLDTQAGPAWVEEGALAAVAECLVAQDGQPAGAEALDALGTAPGRVYLRCADARVPLEPLARAQAPAVLKFEPNPHPPA